MRQLRRVTSWSCSVALRFFLTSEWDLFIKRLRPVFSILLVSDGSISGRRIVSLCYSRWITAQVCGYPPIKHSLPLVSEPSCWCLAASDTVSFPVLSFQLGLRRKNSGRVCWEWRVSIELSSTRGLRGRRRRLLLCCRLIFNVSSAFFRLLRSKELRVWFLIFLLFLSGIYASPCLIMHPDDQLNPVKTPFWSFCLYGN